jgi:hypothetical protein
MEAQARLSSLDCMLSGVKPHQSDAHATATNLKL